ncbi:hypothetical protein ABZ345_22375 [Lentzea sp. NPDC005914]|uniref:hypothetical protein n=1 Tax=Lentzea sp. NPDC005914 TaxID=3154572 RepID=UPI0033E5656B
MAEYLISQHDSRAERVEQVAAVRSVYRYDMDMGFPVAAGTTEADGPAKRWQLKSLEAQESSG